jgi:hypothetical protein
VSSASVSNFHARSTAPARDAAAGTPGASRAAVPNAGHDVALEASGADARAILRVLRTRDSTRDSKGAHPS